MNLLPKSHTDFSEKDYWNNFFKKRGKKAFEWYGEYPELCGQLHKYIKPKDDTLIIGCGNSKLSMDLYDVGYKNITNIDISQVVIRQINELNGNIRPDMKYIQMDALHTTFDNHTFSVILDKGTLDALMPNESTEIQKQANDLFVEIDRITKIGGRYLCVSLLQEHILKQLLDYFPKNNWLFRIVRCHEVEQKTMEDEKGFPMPVFLIICTKFKQLNTMIFECCMIGEKMLRLQSADEMLATIKSVQQTALVCSKLNKTSIVDNGEISMDLFQPGEDTPRYTVFIVDQSPKRQNGQYAVFIVPQGRETEWLFATKDGREKLAKSAQFNRLAIVTMHRHKQQYGDLKMVQQELNEAIQQLAPSSLTNTIPYLSLGNDIGNRNVIFEGTSEFSGPFVVEDFTGDNDQWFRRLIFLRNQNVVQSETKLKNVKVQKKQTLVPDSGYLACEHHVFMTIGVQTAIGSRNENQDTSIAVIGLGGGGLCTFLNHCLTTHLYITAVDIDAIIAQIAVDYFGLVKNDRLTIKIKDGLEFLKESAAVAATGNDMKYKAILFDVDNKDTKLGMSCPPKEFLEPHVLENVKKCLHNDGIFILNLVIRDETLRQPIIESLKKHFNSLITYKLTEELNEIIYCRSTNRDWTNELQLAAEQLNRIAKKKKMLSKNQDFVDVKFLIDSLKINQ